MFHWNECQCVPCPGIDHCLVQAIQSATKLAPDFSGNFRNSPDFFRTHFSIKNNTKSILENSGKFWKILENYGGQMSHFDKVGVRTGHADVHVMRIIRRENRTSQPKPSDACGAISFRLSPLDLGRNEWVTMEHEVLNVLFFVDLQIS
jgi:hypothetical protein